MDFGFTETQLMIKRTAREVAEKEFAPRAAEIDEKAEFPWENIRVLKELGFLGLILPEKYGGGGADHVSFCAVTEEIARVCLTTATTLDAHFLGIYPLLIAGHEEQKAKYLPRLATGEMLAAFGLTEPEAGSDVAALRTTARLEGDYWTLNGTKRFCTNGGPASFYTIFAKTDPTAGHRGVSTFIVEKGTPGFTIGRLENKLGIRGSATAELIFDNCRLPQDNLLGAPGTGFRTAMTTLDYTRLDIGAQAVGVAQGALDAAIRYAKERTTFGRPIAEHQGIAFMLADMATELDAARLLVYRSAAMIDQGAARWTLESAMAKLFAGEMAHRVVHKALQIHGGYGYIKEYPVERFYRDQRITEIYEGTSEIQRMVIARELLR